MRKQMLSVFLPWLLLGLVASAAEAPASQPADQRNELQRVKVVRGADEIRIEISARGAVTPKLTTADSPARLVVDLPGTVMATGQSHITVGNAGVKGVRIGMDGQTPPTTRVVVDLEHACRYELNPTADGKFVLTLHTQQSTASANVPKTVTAPAKVVSPFGPRVMEAKAEVPAKTQPVAASVPVAPKAAVEKSAQATTPKPEAAASTSSDFVFVEPTYAAKNDAAATDPAGRAQEAAAKFSDKTAAELLPARVNAAQSSLNEHGFQHGGLRHYARSQSCCRAEGASGTATGYSRTAVHGRADFSEPEGCGSERLFPSDP